VNFGVVCYQNKIMLVLSEQQVHSLIDIDELIGALEQAHIQYSTGKAVMPVRLVVPLPEIQGRVTSMPGYLNKDKALGMKVVTYFQEPQEKSASDPRHHHAVQPRDRKNHRHHGR
jgi:ornithine cyclodeaminase/alanine dehydrogenase-like protein (mu-crystallin family)